MPDNQPKYARGRIQFGATGDRLNHCSIAITKSKGFANEDVRFEVYGERGRDLPIHLWLSRDDALLLIKDLAVAILPDSD